MTNLQTLRDILQHLTYGEMMTLAEWLANIDKDEDTVNEASFWAYVLHDMGRNLELPEDFTAEGEQQQ